MHRPKRLPISDLNVHLTCKLCKGYFIDATTIIECLHTFCRSCIVKYLETNKYCPVCDVQVHKSKPLLNIRPDKTIQDIVYKLVPRLFQNEIKRRQEFYEAHSDAKPSVLEINTESSYQHLLLPEDTICLTLNYYGNKTMLRYLRCPAGVSVAHLDKLIRAKYELNDNHHVDILYNQDCLKPSLTLMDIAYIYSWKRKGPLELSYKIYEYAAKKVKVEDKETTEEVKPTNNNNWKEVQLRISENGEMSITGIQDTSVDIVNSEKYKSDIVTVVESKPNKANLTTTKKELPGLKYIGNKTPLTSVISSCQSQPVICNNIVSTANNKVNTSQYSNVQLSSSVGNSSPSILIESSQSIANLSTSVPKFILEASNFTNNCVSLSSATTTTVFSTINSSKCSTKTEDSNEMIKKIEPPIVNNLKETISKDPSGAIDKLKSDEVKVEIKMESVESKNESLENEDESLKIKNESPCDVAVLEATVVNNASAVPEKGSKRKSEEAKDEQPVVPPKQTILNHSVGLLNLSNNHPLRKHSKVSRNGENVEKLLPPKHVYNLPLLAKDLESLTKGPLTSIPIVTTQTSETVFSKPNIINKNFVNIQLNRPGTPISQPKQLLNKYPGANPPCYMPKTLYNPVINVPKPITSTITSKPDLKVPVKSDSKQPVAVPKPEMKILQNITLHPPKAESKPQQATANSSQLLANVNNKLNIKTKPSTPIGYKTLRDPPKSWNSQISKANISKPTPDPKFSDSKNVRPAKFFKMRNNMPRYLGNPASGVKPMYQLHVSPEKEKPPEANKAEKSEIRKHSIVKIDPKTLKPISEKAPELTSLSNQSDLKINTSSVSIFNPLKLQSSSPKNDRKSPKSPHSPKLKPSTSPTNKRDKINLNFTPPNPFIPNLASPTVSPNQFLYPSFRAYDPHVMAAYHQLWYQQRMGFPGSPLTGLSLDLNQRKNYDIVPQPSSPNLALTQTLNSQIPPKSPLTTAQSTTQQTTIPRTSNSILPNSSKSPHSSTKKVAKEAGKTEKSLQNAVEKLTQNRVKEVVRNEATITKINNNIEHKANCTESTTLEKKIGHENRKIEESAPPVSTQSNVLSASVKKETENCSGTAQSHRVEKSTIDGGSVKREPVDSDKDRPKVALGSRVSETDSNPSKGPSSVDENAGTKKLANKNSNNNNDTNRADVAEVTGAK